MSDTGAVDPERLGDLERAYARGLAAGFAAAAPTVEEVRRAVGEVLWAVSNYPEAVQARMLGQDTGPLRDKVTDAVAALWGAR